MDVAQIAVSFLTGIAGSLFAAAIFLVLLNRVRPRIIISNQISKQEIGGRTAYQIKVINKTKWPLVNLHAELYHIKPVMVPGAPGKPVRPIWDTRPIQLKRPTLLMLKQFDTADKDADYAFRFTTFENVEDGWSRDMGTFIRFTIYATHSLSGFGSVFEKDYFSAGNAIVSGEFGFGENMDIS